jgi:N utilization substance protein A
MTDEQIKKALECCANNGDCKECAINPHKGNYGYCTSLAIKAALDLINHQKAEIERLKNNLFCKVVIDEENSRMEAVVPQEQFSIAIGRRGQNVKLASQLLGADIDVLTEEQEQERRANENKVRLERFMEALDVDDMIAHLLIAEGFSTIDEVAFVNLKELAEIEGFDEDVATELQRRAKEFVEKRNKDFAKKSKDLGIDEDLKTIDGLDQDMIIKLAENNIKTLDDLADLAADELIEILGENAVTQVEANRVIMAAREHWFADEQ